MPDKENFTHYPVMLKETIEHLECQNGKIYVDATLGGGGHSREIAKLIQPEGKLFSFDVDPIAISHAEKKLEEFSKNVTIVKANYNKIPEMLKKFNIDKITGGIVFDLGASYYQLTSSERGFSFKKNSKLDMRFDPSSNLSAYDIVNSYKEDELYKIIKEYGEERYTGRIVRHILEKRAIKPIETTFELSDLIINAVPRSKEKIHPATRVFQGIRIAVNNELKNFENSLKTIVPLLEKDAKIVVISFHSLEDRLVKNLFRYYASDCNCLPNQMICNCPPRQIKILTKKPITASDEELKENPPSRSAKIRVAVRV